jgi:hypothetical protein
MLEIKQKLLVDFFRPKSPKYKLWPDLTAFCHTHYIPYLWA